MTDTTDHTPRAEPLRRDEALRILREHAPELERRFGVASVALFGSVARDEARPDSDVDLVVAFHPGAATFVGYFELVDRLEALLGAPVDVVSLAKLLPRLRVSVEREMIRVA
jgi:hypothetical protein